MIDSRYKDAWSHTCEWLAWLGCPMVYDGTLCVCRSIEDRIERARYHKVSL